VDQLGDASRYHVKGPDEIDWSLPERQTRAVAEFLAALDDEDPNAARKLPTVISPMMFAHAVPGARLELRAPQRRSSNANSLCGQNSVRFSEICASFQRDILRRHF
jgi:hypothetical protein